LPASHKPKNRAGNGAHVLCDGRAFAMTAPRRMLLEEQVLDLIPISKTTLWRMEKAGKFPRSTFLSPNRRAWFEDEITKWQETVDERQPNRGRGKGRRPKAETSTPDAAGAR
jgi:prophage regulatory protein